MRLLTLVFIGLVQNFFLWVTRFNCKERYVPIKPVVLELGPKSRDQGLGSCGSPTQWPPSQGEVILLVIQTHPQDCAFTGMLAHHYYCLWGRRFVPSRETVKLPSKLSMVWRFSFLEEHSKATATPLGLMIPYDQSFLQDLCNLYVTLSESWGSLPHLHSRHRACC